MTIAAHPLQWPFGWPRTYPDEREGARFGRARQRQGDRYVGPRPLTIMESLVRVREQLSLMRVSPDDFVVSSNLALRLDGFPRSDQREPDDPGVAVYWQHGSDRKVMAIDRYLRVADNLAAVAATLDAMRAIERHGGAVVMDRAFTGFAALPSPAAAKRDCWDVLDTSPLDSVEAIKARYRVLASLAHPDKPGGSHARMAELNVALQEALEAKR